MFGKTPLTPEEKKIRDEKRAREREERRAADAREREERRAEEALAAAYRAEARADRFAAMPEFVVRESREVTVKAENMQDAIALAAAAFKEGQDSDHTIKWHKPFGIEGDTIDKIRIINVKAGQIS